MVQLDLDLTPLGIVRVAGAFRNGRNWGAPGIRRGGNSKHAAGPSGHAELIVELSGQLDGLDAPNGHSRRSIITRDYFNSPKLEWRESE